MRNIIGHYLTVIGEALLERREPRKERRLLGFCENESGLLLFAGLSNLDGNIEERLSEELHDSGIELGREVLDKTSVAIVAKQTGYFQVYAEYKRGNLHRIIVMRPGSRLLRITRSSR